MPHSGREIPSEERVAERRRRESQVPERRFGGFAAAGRAFEEAFLDQERLVNLLDRSGVFADGRGDGVQSYGTAAELFDDRSEDLVCLLYTSDAADD